MQLILQGIHAQCLLLYVSFLDNGEDDIYSNDSDDEEFGRSELTLWCTYSKLHVINYKCITFTPQIKGAPWATFTMSLSL